MGGVVRLGYRVEDRSLHIVDDHAVIVRSLFQRYLEAGSVVCLKQSLDAEGLGFRFALMTQAARPGRLVQPRLASPAIKWERLFWAESGRRPNRSWVPSPTENEAAPVKSVIQLTPCLLISCYGFQVRDCWIPARRQMSSAASSLNFGALRLEDYDVIPTLPNTA